MPQTHVIIEIRPVLLFILHNTRNIAYIIEELIFYADQIMLMGSSKNSCVFNFAFFTQNRENLNNLMLTKYTCFTVVGIVHYAVS